MKLKNATCQHNKLLYHNLPVFSLMSVSPVTYQHITIAKDSPTFWLANNRLTVIFWEGKKNR
jgi:hypothetical protein